MDPSARPRLSAQSTSESSPYGSPTHAPARSLNRLLMAEGSPPPVLRLSQIIDPRKVQVIDTSLLQTIKEAKTIEWKAVYDALKASVQAFLDRHNISQELKPHIALKALLRTHPLPETKEQLRQSLSRFIFQTCMSANVPPPANREEVIDELIHKLNTSASESVYDTLEAPLKAFFAIAKIPYDSEIFCKKLAELSYIFAPENQSILLQQHYDTLLSNVETICHLLLDTQVVHPDHYKAIVQTILILYLRPALNNPLYQACKTNEAILPVQFLHGLCLASFTEPKLIPACKLLGEKIHKMQGHSESSSLDEVLFKTWEEAAKHGIAIDDPSDKDSFWRRARESVTLFVQTVEAGLPVRDAINNFYSHVSAPTSVKDYHGHYDNNQSCLSEESVSYLDKAFLARTVFTASPACGNTISEEFTALLQTIENNHFELSPHPTIFYCISYTNLQSKANGSEGDQTRALMLLNKMYPFSIRLITISEDSFASKIKATSLNESVKDEFYSALVANDSFQLCKAPGFYFPPEEQRLWELVCRHVVDCSFQLLKNLPGKEPIVAFCELVKFSLIRFHEMRSLMHFAHKNIPNGSSTIRIRACAPSADRGGKRNVFDLWALGNEADPEWNQFLAHVFVGRATLAKGRLPLAGRVNEMSFTSNQVAPAKVKELIAETDHLAYLSETLTLQEFAEHLENAERTFFAHTAPATLRSNGIRVFT